MTGTSADEAERVPRMPGCVLWIDEKAWESGSQVRAVHPPIPVDTWADATLSKGYKVVWTPEGAIEEGPYRGGSVVEVVSDVPGDAGRTYFAIPPEALDGLREIMRPDEYRMVREDIANIDNEEAHGFTVTRLDPAAWEERGEVVPVAEPITTEAWVREIRQRHMRVFPPSGHSLPLASFYPAGLVVSVHDATGRGYFAVPRAAYWLAYALADGTADAELSSAPVPAVATTARRESRV
jgi:hypothetical protein